MAIRTQRQPIRVTTSQNVVFRARSVLGVYRNTNIKTAYEQIFLDQKSTARETVPLLQTSLGNSERRCMTRKGSRLSFALPRFPRIP